jgi:hypothetical protein
VTTLTPEFYKRQRGRPPDAWRIAAGAQPGGDPPRLYPGSTRGLLDVLARDAMLIGFVPHDRDEAGCTIEVRGL